MNMDLNSLTVADLEALLAAKRQQERDEARRQVKSKCIDRVRVVEMSLETTVNSHISRIRQCRDTIQTMRQQIRTTRRKLSAARRRLDVVRGAVAELESMDVVTDDLVLQVVKGLYANRRVVQGS